MPRILVSISRKLRGIPTNATAAENIYNGVFECSEANKVNYSGDTVQYSTKGQSTQALGCGVSWETLKKVSCRRVILASGCLGRHHLTWLARAVARLLLTVLYLCIATIFRSFRLILLERTFHQTASTQLFVTTIAP